MPLAKGSHANARAYAVQDGQLLVNLGKTSTTLADSTQLAGYTGNPSAPESLLLKKNQLHIELQFDSTGNIGSDDKANIQDIILESAITTIQDCEDSVAAVDAEDKTEVYRNWLGLMRGDLNTSFNKGGELKQRGLNPDRHYHSANGEPFSLSGRSLLLVRNVGHLMTNPAVLDCISAGTRRYYGWHSDRHYCLIRHATEKHLSQLCHWRHVYCKALKCMDRGSSVYL